MPVQCTCLQCGLSFTVRPYVIKSGGGRYCSNSCRATACFTYTDERFWEAFWEKTRREGDCLIWTAKQSTHTVSKGGPRGLVKVKGRWRYAHKVALEQKLGRPVVKPMQANHTCDRPLCVEPEHLYEGTQAQNVKDRDARGRGWWLRGEDHPSAKLTEEQVREIKIALKDGDPQIALAILYGVSDVLISAIATGKIWRHVVV